MPFHAFRRYLSLTAPNPTTECEVQPEEQNSDYESGIALLGQEWWRVRTARITPTKPGAFVATWRRDADGKTRPFRAGETLAGLLVFVAEEERFGVFRFSPEDLVSLGYVTSESHPGKRGFRVYPTWSQGLNPGALRTQRAHAAAFEQLA